jgi:hypothetical protein
MKIEYLSAFVLSQLYGSFLSVLTPGDRGAPHKLFDASSRWPSLPMFQIRFFDTPTCVTDSLDSWGDVVCVAIVLQPARVTTDWVSQPPERPCL